jgi:short subunit dehydrogenase-like uncharacterized protein
MQWLIYGAYGYTGDLIARKAVEQGMRPVLAGRSEAKLAPLANELGLDHRAFALDDPAAVREGLTAISLVLHCAGPFSATSAPMIEGCLAAGAHYLDITGEISVFEHAHARAQADRAREQGVVICPGVGFDVIPTDCVALKLKELMPDATWLSLGFDSSSGLSPGTAKSSVEGMAQGCMVRRGGSITRVPLGWKQRRIDFGRGEKSAMVIPWGDVSTAYYTTGIANIDTWIPAPKAMIWGARMANLIRPLLGLGAVQRRLKKNIEGKVRGPDENRRATQPTWVWGEARNAAGERLTVRIKTANGYSLTVDGSLAVTRHLLEAAPAGGSYTPAMLLGSHLVETLPGSESFRVD